MVSCALCDLKGISDAIVLDANTCYVAVNPFPTLKGEIIIVPKAHYTIFEQIPFETLSEIALLTKYFSAVLFEALQSQGTNIIIQNGSSAGQMIAHSSVRIIPRNNPSELDTGWDAKTLSQDDLNEYAKIIIDSLMKLNNPKEETVKEVSKIEENKTITPSENAIPMKKEEREDFFKKHWEEDDYMKKQLFRKP